jgi:outer membrane murein-binding lipoprotein Lpp
MTKQSKINALKLSAQRGFSNVQIAIGILVGVIILLGSLGGYQYINQAKVNNEITTLADLKAATVRYGQFAGLFTSTNVTLAILSGQNFFNGAGLASSGSGTDLVISNQWGGKVTVAVGTAGVAGDSIDFTFTNVPSNACQELGSKVDNLVAKVKIGTTDTKAVGAASNLASVTTACTGGGQANTIIYTMQK